MSSLRSRPGWTILAVLCRNGLLERHRGAPLGVLRHATVDDVEVARLELGRDRADLAVADRTAVDLQQRRHVGRRAGHEHLIGDVELAAVDAAGLDLEAVLALRQ